MPTNTSTSGFLADLGLSNFDEQEAYLRATQSNVNPNFSRSGSSAGDFMNLGRELGGTIGKGAQDVVHGVKGLIDGEGGRGFREFGRDIKAGRANARDKKIAEGMGLPGGVDELRKKRAAFKDINEATADIPDDGTFESRRALAAKVAEIGKQRGLAPMVARALQQIQQLDIEEQEFNKLKASTKSAQNKADTENIRDIYLPGETEPRAALITAEGAETVDGIIPNGRYSFEGPDAKGNGETLDQRYRKVVPASQRALISNSIVTANSALRQYRRVLSTVRDLSEEGGINSVLSTSGTILSKVDNLFRNIEGIVDPILRNGGKTRYNGKLTSSAEARKDVRRRGSDPFSDFWLDDNGNNILPPEFRSASAAAQNHRAMIMELAYLAARMAEPSNRGLSDNDIKNAMKRIAGDTSNPQVMMRRFAEMTFDNSHMVEGLIDTYRGTFSDVDDEDFDFFVGGKALADYRIGLSKLQEDFGFTIDEDGRAVIAQEVDVDVQPGEGIPGLAVAPGTISVEEDDEFLRNN